MAKIGFAITSSFCTVSKIIEQMINLKDLGYDIIPIVSPAVIEKDTRFGKGENFKIMIEEIKIEEIKKSYARMHMT